MFIAPSGGYPGMMPYHMGPMMQYPAWMPYQVDEHGNPIEMIVPDGIHQEQSQQVFDEHANGEEN